MNRMERIALVCAPVLGALIGYVDSRPTWDDTGVTAAAVLVTGALLAAAARRRPWLIACAVGIWVPLMGIAGSNNYGSLIALAFAFGGAYTGVYVRRMLSV